MEQQFNAVFDDQVDEVHVCYNTRELDKLVSEYKQTFLKLQDQIDEYVRLDKLRRKIKRQKVPHPGHISLNTPKSSVHGMINIDELLPFPEILCCTSTCLHCRVHDALISQPVFLL